MACWSQFSVDPKYQAWLLSNSNEEKPERERERESY